MRTPTLVLAGLAAALLGGAAEATTLRFAASTQCNDNCAAAGLLTGQRVDAVLKISDARFAPGGSLDGDDLVGFRVDFGGNSMTNATVFGSSFYAQWGDTRGEIASFSLQAADGVAPFTGPAFGMSNVLPSAFSNDGFCLNATCGLIELGNYAAASPAEISAVPAPPALLLAATGVAGLAFVRRRRRRAPA